LSRSSARKTERRVLTAYDGSVVHRNPWPAELAHIGPPAAPVTIQANKTLEGDIKLSEMPISGYPRNEDLILFWSYGVRTWPSGELLFHGATFLKSER
jgi:hypothetical protein